MGLRSRTLNQIAAALEQNGFFKAADFSVSTKDAATKTDLSIVYSYKSDFIFLAAIGLEKNALGQFLIGSRYCPGELNETETATVANIDGLLAALTAWTARIKGETLAAPEMRAFEEQKRLISELMAGVSQRPDDEYFTQEEANDLRSRLDALEQTLAKNFTENTDDKAQLANKIKALTADVEMLRDNLLYLTKQNWASALCARAFGWLKDPANQKLLTSGAQVVQTLLSDGVKHAGSGS